MVKTTVRGLVQVLVTLVLVQRTSSTGLHMDVYELVCFLVGGANSCAPKTCPAGQVKRPRPNFKVRSVWGPRG